jgi:5'-nucleotidase (lipoprotein e(P4) family)
MTIRRVACIACVAVATWTTAAAQQPLTVRETGIKYVRDSEEYATLTRQVYRLAGDAVTRTANDSASRSWAVVLDVDETALDNSTYQLERAAYGLPYDDGSWGKWVERREATAVPGVVGFVEVVRRAGGRVAWITNRDASLTDATRANLKTVGVWTDDDRLCAQKTQYTKADRRREVVTGKGDCSWPSTPMRVVVFVGDQLGDFPEASEQIPQTGSDAAFGRTCFLLPNSMYGAWTTRVTRVVK